MDIHSIFNAHAKKALLKPAEIPSVTLAIDNDEMHTSVPILLFREQYQPPQIPVVQQEYEMKFEDVQKNGSGATLSLEDFSTDMFDIGSPYGGAY